MLSNFHLKSAASLNILSVMFWVKHALKSTTGYIVFNTKNDADVLQSKVIKYGCIVGLNVAVIGLEGNDDRSIFVKPAFDSQSPVEKSTLRNDYGVALFHEKSKVELGIALCGLLQLQLV